MLYTDHENTLINNKLDEISSFLIDYDVSNLSTIGIRYGKLGVVLFLLLRYDFTGEQHFLLKANSIIDDVLNELLNGKISHKRTRENLIDFGRFMEFAKSQHLYDCDTNLFLKDLDEHLADEMVKLLEIGDYDVIDGALSMGYYYLLRYNSNAEVEKYLKLLIKNLYMLAQKDKKNQLYWVSTLFDGDRIYLGVHGSAQIILYAAKLYHLDIEKELCLEVIKKGAAFIADNKIESNICHFPIVIDYPIERGPLEWAYGDLQVAYALYVTGEILNNEDYIKLATDAYDFAATRIFNERVVVDAGLVHGIMGTAMMFNKLYMLTNYEHYKRAVKNCCERALKEFFTSDSPYLGYKAKYDIDIPGSDISFISGLAGIGVALMAVQNSKYQKFDQLLFI